MRNLRFQLRSASAGVATGARDDTATGSRLVGCYATTRHSGVATAAHFVAARGRRRAETMVAALGSHIGFTARGALLPREEVPQKEGRGTPTMGLLFVP